jgi:uncharacterized protein (DUF952 family)
MPRWPAGARIFHLLTRPVWAHEQARSGPVAVDQFEHHGFVHCCFREQLTEVANWWFDADSDLVALELDPTRLPLDRLLLEPSPSRWYPHLYAPIDPAAVVATHPLPRDDAGAAQLPSALAVPPPAFRVTDGAGRTVTWRSGALEGDASWTASVAAAVDDARPVELLGGIHRPATTATAFEAFALLDTVADGGTARYEGDGTF